MNAEFFDIFGFVGFAILLFCGIKILSSGNKKIKRYGLTVTIISIIGLVVDSYVILTSFILK